MPTLEQARLWYPPDAVHGFDHVERVYRMALKLAALENADAEIVGAAALLHDAVAAHLEGGARAEHHHASAEFAAQILATENWQSARIAAVQHCIRAHRFRATESPQTLEAKILFDADKLDVIGASGVARTIAYAVQAGQPAYAPPSARFLATGEKEPNEPHSAYHEYLFKLRHIANTLHTPTARALAQKRHQILQNFFEALAEEQSA